MVRKSASELRDSQSDLKLAIELGKALRGELGASRRATKTIMRWTGVSDTTARSWLQGVSCPSGSHLLALASHSLAVMIVVLQLTGHENLEIGLDLRTIERSLAEALILVREALTSPSRETSAKR